MTNEMTIQEIADLVDGEIENIPPGETVSEVMTIQEAGPEAVTFLSNPKYQKYLKTTEARCVLVGPEIEAGDRGVVRCRNPYLGFALVCKAFAPPIPKDEPGIHPDASVDASASIGEEATIMAGAVVCAGARVGDRSVLHPGAVVGHGVEVGADCLLYANTTIYHGCRLGDRVVIHSGTVIGGDGYGFATDFQNGRHVKIPQMGGVRIADDVEIGSGCTIDRGAIGDTIIGRGTKIDNQVQLGHNVVIGEHCFIVAQAGISGSTTIGDWAVIAAQAGIVGHLNIGSGARVGAQSGVSRDIPSGEEVLGTPAVDSSRCRRIYASWKRLPELRKRVARLERQLEEG